jgi:hypothetical protein
VGSWRNDWRTIPGGSKRLFLYSTESRPDLEPIQRTIQRVPDAHSPGSVIETRLHLVQVRNGGAKPLPPPPTPPPWRENGLRNGTTLSITFITDPTQWTFFRIRYPHVLYDRGFGVQVPVGSRIFTSPHRPDRLWGTPSLLSNGYWGSFPGSKASNSCS